MKLFCIPHAGGSTIAYNVWKKHLDEHIEFVPLDLPGHMPRIREPLSDSMEEIVTDLTHLIKKNLNGNEPYAIYGHSMGGMLLYFLYFRLVEEGLTLPVNLFFSSRWPPYHNNKKAYYDLSNEEECRHRLIEMGGFSPEVLNNKALLDYYLNVLIADYHVIQSVGTCKPDKMYVDMTLLWSDNEPDIADEDIYTWKKSAGKGITFVKMKGSHFFPTEEPMKTTNIINTTLRKYMERGIVS
ncbi:thioesterase II family protein [Longirhabdus pacifica]|uniref:thioesterase II family protein n=1 Tax=Longirhabdus pacifica TaxID=2305227 RepID=UPI0010093C4C|nr:alpha/beta fold hydrolase [Longirhabdus pacifica]